MQTQTRISTAPSTTHTQLPWPSGRFPRIAKHWTASLMALGVAGIWVYGLTTVELERNWYQPGKAPPLPDVDPIQHPHREPTGYREPSWPKFSEAWGGRTGGFIVGGVFTGVGVFMAMAATIFLLREGLALARRRNAQHPAYMRPYLYAGAQSTAIVASGAHRFFHEAARDYGRTDLMWKMAVLGLYGNGIFAVTQAQAVSNSELLRGEVFPQWRNNISRGARFTAGVMMSISAALAGIPNADPYGRESVRLVALSALTIAYVAPLTRARDISTALQRLESRLPDDTMGRRGRRIPPWTWPLVTLGGAFTGRIFTGMSAVPLAQAVRDKFLQPIQQPGYFPVPGGRPAAATTAAQALAAAAEKKWRIGLALQAVGLAASFGSTYAFWQQAKKHDRRAAHVLSGLSVVAAVSLASYRLILEIAKPRVELRLLYWATLPGCVGTGLQFLVLPDLFTYSQLTYGRAPLPRFDEALQALRAIGGMALHLWVIESGVAGFNPITRETTFMLASIGILLAFSLSTAAVVHAETEVDDDGPQQLGDGEIIEMQPRLAAHP